MHASRSWAAETALLVYDFSHSLYEYAVAGAQEQRCLSIKTESNIGLSGSPELDASAACMLILLHVTISLLEIAPRRSPFSEASLVCWSSIITVHVESNPPIQTLDASLVPILQSGIDPLPEARLSLLLNSFNLTSRCGSVPSRRSPCMDRMV